MKSISAPHIIHGLHWNDYLIVRIPDKSNSSCAMCYKGRMLILSFIAIIVGAAIGPLNIISEKRQ